jgi:hypothetical protein
MNEKKVVIDTGVFSRELLEKIVNSINKNKKLKGVTK